MRSLRNLLPVIALVLLAPSVSIAQTDPPMPWPNRRVPTYTDADYVSMWEDMSRPPVEWVVLTEMVEEAEGKTEPNDRAYLLSEALKRLEKYIESTDEPSRMSAGN